MSVVIHQESLTETFIHEVAPLLARHWREIALYQEDVPLDLDWKVYRRMNEEGTLLLIAARDEGRLAGYAAFFLVRSPHYKSTLCGMNDVIFVAPEFRKSHIGLRLIRESESLLSTRGVKLIRWHVKQFNADGTDNPLYKILVRLGYRLEELTVGKLL